MLSVINVFFKIIEHVQLLIDARDLLLDTVDYLESVSPDLCYLIKICVAEINRVYF